MGDRKLDKDSPQDMQWGDAFSLSLSSLPLSLGCLS